MAYEHYGEVRLVNSNLVTPLYQNPEISEKQKAIKLLVDMIYGTFRHYHVLVMVQLGEWYLKDNKFELANDILIKAIIAFEKYGYTNEHYYFYAKYLLAQMYFQSKMFEAALGLIEDKFQMDRVQNINPLRLKVEAEVNSDLIDKSNYEAETVSGKTIYYEKDEVNILINFYINYSILLCQVYRKLGKNHESKLGLNSLMDEFDGYLQFSREYGYILLELALAFYDNNQMTVAFTFSVNSVMYFESINQTKDKAYGIATTMMKDCLVELQNLKDGTILEQCLDTASNLGMYHEQYAACLYSVGTYFKETNNSAKAKSLLLNAKEIYSNLNPEAHKDILAALDKQLQFLR